MAEADLGEGPAAIAALLDPARVADPYPTYARWREDRPRFSAGDGLFVCATHEDCAAVLRDPRFGHPEGDGDAPARAERPAVRSFLGLNPPDHTRLRRLVSRAFTPSSVAALAPRIEALTADLLAAARASGGEVDLVTAVARPLPVAVISELLGIPPADRAALVGWSDALARGLEPAFLVPADERARQVRAREELTGYLAALAARRRAEPGEDLVSALVRVRDEQDTLAEEELVATCVLLLVAGHETTVGLLGTATLALLRNPEALESLRRDPGLAEGAVEELLRYDSPVQLTSRFALADAAIGDLVVPAGSFVLLLLGAANRDPRWCADPDRLDLTRVPSRHLAFGQGIHFCLGAPLARLEAQVALRALAAEASLELAGTPEWKSQVVLRGLSRLPVRFGAGVPGTARLGR